MFVLVMDNIILILWPKQKRLMGAYKLIETTVIHLVWDPYGDALNAMNQSFVNVPLFVLHNYVNS